MKEKLSDKQIQDLFQEGNLIARSLHVEDAEVKDNEIKSNFTEFENEMKFLGTQRKGGNYSNVDRDGQRDRSATLLVPGVNMKLFAEIGVLYDADKSTIRAYMYQDSVTTSQVGHNNFYNINEDKNKFQPIISKKDFLAKYKDYRTATDNTNKEHTQYNEVLGNFFPESVCGLVSKDNEPKNKLKLLEAKQLMSRKYNLDLPMVIMDRGKVTTWQPGLDEISELLNYKRTEINRIAITDLNQNKEELIKSFNRNLGFEVSTGSQDKISAKDIILLNKDEITSKELIEFIHKNTGIPEGGKFTYGIKGRLENILNEKSKQHGTNQKNILDNSIIDKKDVKKLIENLSKEIASNDEGYKAMNNAELQNLSEAIIKGIINKRSMNTNQESISLGEIKDDLKKHIPNNKFSKIKEFLYKVAEFLDEKLKINHVTNISKNSKNNMRSY